jgi:hypothetical protein
MNKIGDLYHHLEAFPRRRQFGLEIRTLLIAMILPECAILTAFNWQRMWKQSAQHRAGHAWRLMVRFCERMLFPFQRFEELSLKLLSVISFPQTRAIPSISRPF